MNQKNQSKFKNAFVSGVKKEQEQIQEQLHLHDKYGVDDSNILVVEKTNAWKWIINKFIELIRFTAITTILILAAIGLFSVIYPNIRSEFLLTAMQVFEQIKNLF